MADITTLGQKCEEKAVGSLPRVSEPSEPQPPTPPALPKQPILIDFKSAVEARQRRTTENKKVTDMKEFSDRLHELMVEGSEILQPLEIAAVMIHYVKKLIMCSFEGLKPAEKQDRRLHALSFLAQILTGKKS